MLFEVPENYLPFLSERQPDVRLQIYSGFLPSWNTSSPVFETHGLWSLYWDDGRWVLACMPVNGEPLLVAIFAPDFCSGNVYLRIPWAEQKMRCPLSYPLDELLFINLLARQRGVLVHAFAVKDGNEGLLFAGVSEAGKSTSARIWQQQQGVTLLSDDRVILRKRDGQFWMYGTPWHGDARIASPEGGPLNRIFVIQHAPQNYAVKLSAVEMAAHLLVRAFPTFWYAEGMDFALKFLDELVQTVPCYELGFVPDSSVVDFVRCLPSG